MPNSKKVLLVDDDLMFIENRLKAALSRKGIALVMAEDTATALAATAGDRFDLIIVDIGLKDGETGLELVRRIRQTDKTTKIFVLTGYNEDYSPQAQEAGADEYFVKPMDYTKHIFQALGVE